MGFKMGWTWACYMILYLGKVSQLGGRDLNLQTKAKRPIYGTWLGFAVYHVSKVIRQNSCWVCYCWVIWCPISTSIEQIQTKDGSLSVVQSEELKNWILKKLARAKISLPLICIRETGSVDACAFRPARKGEKSTVCVRGKMQCHQIIRYLQVSGLLLQWFIILSMRAERIENHLRLWWL